MVTYDRTQEREFAQQPRLRICVAGIGGAGLNVLDRISMDRMMEASLVSMHTDVRVLSQAMAPVKIQLGADIMRGIGSGGDPELGREAAISSREHIKAALQGHDMVFLCIGLGGGTGSGAAPIVAEVAKEVGAMVFVFATMPFPFEGRRRLRQAEVALEEVERNTDGLVLFENSRMGELILPKEGIQKAFSQADQLIGHSVRAIASMVTQPGLVRVSMADLTTALRSPNSRCLFGFGEARGANRVTEALKRALKSPLVNQGQLLQSTRNLLVHVAGGEGLALSEVEVLMKNVGKYVPDQTQILFGLTVDPKLGDTLVVTLLSSLTAQEMVLESPVAAAMDRIAAQPAEHDESRASSRLPVAHSNGSAAPAKAPAKPAIAAPPAVPAEEGLPIADLFTAPILARTEATPPPLPQPAPPVIAAVAPPVEAIVAPVVQPQLVVEEKLAAPIVQAPVAEVAPAPAPAPVMEVVAPPVQETPPVIVAEAPPAPAPVPAPVVAAPVAPPAPARPPSVFAVVPDDEDYYEDEEEEAAPVAHAPAPETRSVVAAIAHSAPPAPVEEHAPVEATPHVFDTVKAAAQPAKPKTDYQQASFNLNQQEVTRFKGTEKIFDGGEDLDVPTWMRARQKQKA